jgi:hypothetical protein
MEDPLSGCKIWTDEMMPDQLASWSGDWRDGKASGKGVLSEVREGKLVVGFDGTTEAGEGADLGTVTSTSDEGGMGYVGTVEQNTLDGYGMVMGPKGGTTLASSSGTSPTASACT